MTAIRTRLLLAVAAATSLHACGGGGSGTDAAEAEYRTVRSAPLFDPTTPPPPGEPRPFSLPTPIEMTLSNGLSVTLIERPGLPTVSFRVSIDGGFSALPGDMGTTTLLTRTLRDGAGAWTDDDVSRLIDANGIAFDASIDHDAIRLSADALSTQFATVVDLIATLVAAPTFPEDRVEARRGEVLGELELAAAQPDFHLQRAIRRAIFPAGHPYAQAWPSAAEVEAVQAGALPDAWRALAGPSVARLVVVGDLPGDAVARIAEAFGAWSGGPEAPIRPAEVQVAACNVAHVVVRPNSVQTSIAWLGAGVPVGGDGWFDALVANQVLGGGPSARLFMNLREDKSFTYGAYSTLEQWAGGVFRAASSVRSDVTEPALAEFVAEFSRFATDPLDDLGDATAYLSGVFPIEHQTNAQVAARVAWLLDHGVPLDYLDTYRGAVSGATEPAVRASGATLFDPAHLTLVMVGERDIAVPAAEANASRVYVYDLDGQLAEERSGSLASTCPAAQTE